MTPDYGDRFSGGEEEWEHVGIANSRDDTEGTDDHQQQQPDPATSPPGSKGRQRPGAGSPPGWASQDPGAMGQGPAGGEETAQTQGGGDVDQAQAQGVQDQPPDQGGEEDAQGDAPGVDDDKVTLSPEQIEQIGKQLAQELMEGFQKILQEQGGFDPQALQQLEGAGGDEQAESQEDTGGDQAEEGFAEGGQGEGEGNPDEGSTTATDGTDAGGEELDTGPDYTGIQDPFGGEGLDDPEEDNPLLGPGDYEEGSEEEDY